MRRRKEGRRCHQDEPLTHFENYFLPTTKVQTESPFLSPRDYRVSGSRIRNALSNCLKLPSLVRNSRMRPNSSCLGDHRNHERETTFIDSSLLLQLFTRLTREHGRLAFIVQVLLCEQNISRHTPPSHSPKSHGYPATQVAGCAHAGAPCATWDTRTRSTGSRGILHVAPQARNFLLYGRGHDFYTSFHGSPLFKRMRNVVGKISRGCEDMEMKMVTHFIELRARLADLLPIEIRLRWMIREHAIDYNGTRRCKRHTIITRRISSR